MAMAVPLIALRRRSVSGAVQLGTTCLRNRAISARSAAGARPVSPLPSSRPPYPDSAAALASTCRNEGDGVSLRVDRRPIQRSSVGRDALGNWKLSFPPFSCSSSSSAAPSAPILPAWQRWRESAHSFPAANARGSAAAAAVAVVDLSRHLSLPLMGFSPSSSSALKKKMVTAAAMAMAASPLSISFSCSRNLVGGTNIQRQEREQGVEEEEEEEEVKEKESGGKSGGRPSAPPRGAILAADIRDLAIIAHVDHGKTTLMDRLLRHCGLDVEGERVMDNITLEKERGITIASKCTSFEYKGFMLNVVDTPGHADFGGEVERVLDMVDGVVLLVDATEGPLAQTKFVLGKALRKNLRPLVVLNKADRPTVTRERCADVENQIFDLFASLDASDEQLDFPLLYASARDGWASKELLPPRVVDGDGGPSSSSSSFVEKTAMANGDMSVLLDAIVEHVPAPTGDPDAPFRFLVSMIDRDPYVGRIVTGRVADGSVRVGDRVVVLRRQAAELDGKSSVESGGTGGGCTAQVTRIFKTRGTTRTAVDLAGAGDIVSIAGISDAGVTDTIANPLAVSPLQATPIDPPTIMMSFAVNDSPFAGRDGSLLTGSKIGERLRAEAETNVSITVEATRGNDAFHVCGRGELQLGVLIENMRREGFELSISPPKVLYRKDEQTGGTLEPIEEVVVEVDDEYAGRVIEGISLRVGDLTAMVPNAAGTGKTRLSFTCPSRGLIGYRSVFNTETRGTGIIHRSFLGYETKRGLLDRIRKGVLVSMTSGTITAHALTSLEARGILFVEPQTECYDGMIIGEHSREGDLEVNPVRTKHLSNVRSAGNDENVRLAPPRQLSLEEAIGYVGADELIEVTPRAIRLRKRHLNSTDRKTLRRNKSIDT